MRYEIFSSRRLEKYEEICSIHVSISLLFLFQGELFISLPLLWGLVDLYADIHAMDLVRAVFTLFHSFCCAIGILVLSNVLYAAWCLR